MSEMEFSPMPDAPADPEPSVDIPSEPEPAPDIPEEVPAEPEPSLEISEETPAEPEVASDISEETPAELEPSADIPTDIPIESEPSPDIPTDMPVEPQPSSDIPTDIPIEPESSPDVPNEMPAEPTPIDKSPESVGEGQSVVLPEGEENPSIIGPEQAERYHNPETTKEIGVGTGPNPSFDQPPGAGQDTPILSSQEITLENGETVKVTGEVDAFKELNHQQGEVPGFEGTCGLCSVQCVANQFGLQNEAGGKISEEDIVKLASDNNPSLCVTDSTSESNGGTSLSDQQELLERLGIPAHVETDMNMEQLAQQVDQGKGVITGVNADELWGQNPHNSINLLPRPNHAVSVIGTARNPGTNELRGFFINDSGNNEGNIGSGRFVSTADMLFSWQNHGTGCVVTDQSFPRPARSK